MCSGRPRRGSLLRAVALAACAARHPRASWPGKSAPLPAAPITGSCFCLALRRPVCPNPQPLPGLHLLPPPPFSPRLPPPQPPAPQLRPRVCAAATPWCAQVPSSGLGALAEGERECAGRTPGLQGHRGRLEEGAPGQGLGSRRREGRRARPAADHGPCASPGAPKKAPEACALKRGRAPCPPPVAWGH